MVDPAGCPMAAASARALAAWLLPSAVEKYWSKFRGKVVAAYPQDDDATLYDFNSITRD